jgi:hypothetical protein
VSPITIGKPPGHVSVEVRLAVALNRDIQFDRTEM